MPKLNTVYDIGAAFESIENELMPTHIADHGRYKLIFYGFKSSSNVVDSIKLWHLRLPPVCIYLKALAFKYSDHVLQLCFAGTGIISKLSIIILFQSVHAHRYLPLCYFQKLLALLSVHPVDPWSYFYLHHSHLLPDLFQILLLSW